MLPLGNGNQALTKGTNSSRGLEEAANRKNQAVESTDGCSVKTALSEEPEIYEPRKITDHVEISDFRRNKARFGKFAFQFPLGVAAMVPEVRVDRRVKFGSRRHQQANRSVGFDSFVPVGQFRAVIGDVLENVDRVDCIESTIAWNVLL